MTETTATSDSGDTAGDGQRPPPHDLKWFEKPGMSNMLIVGLLGVGIAFVLLGMMFHGDSKLTIKKIPGFYALSAIASVAAAALAARVLRGVFYVREDYYDR